MPTDAYLEPLTATPCGRAVVVYCDHRPFAVALTPQAARESARLILAAAERVEASGLRAPPPGGADA